jgi:hypothetical protein
VGSRYFAKNPLAQRRELHCMPIESRSRRPDRVVKAGGMVVLWYWKPIAHQVARHRLCHSTPEPK